MPSKVSIVIPIYNVEKYLGDCLNSVINQTLHDIEIICIDDASTDGSLSILEEYEVRDKRIHVLKNEQNKGLSYTRNRGLDYADGTYIYFLDSDDRITSEAMEELYIMAEKNNTDVITFDARFMYENEQLKEKRKQSEGSRNTIYSGIYSGESLMEAFLENNDFVSVAQRYFIRKGFLNSINLRFYEGILHEDELFTFLLISKAKRILVEPKQYFIRYIRENSITTSKPSVKNFSGFWHVLKETLLYGEQYERENGNVCAVINKRIKGLARGLVGRYGQIKDDITTDEMKSLMPEEVLTLLVLHEQRMMFTQEGYMLEDITPLQDKKTIFIYGAGLIAARIDYCLEKEGIAVDGFIVSDKINSPHVYRGRRVFSLDDLREKTNITIVLGVSEKYKKEILEMMKMRGYENPVELILLEKPLLSK